MRTSSRGFGRYKLFRVGGITVPYRLIRRNVRYPRLEFKTGELLVIIPRRTKDETEVLERKASWIVEKYAQIERSVKRIAEKICPEGLLVFGKSYLPGEEGKVRIKADQQVIELVPTDERKTMRLLRRLLKAKLERWVQMYSRRFGVRANRIFIRTQKTKWASCSGRGNLSFNLKLVHLPPELIQYVVCHEVAHLRAKKHDAQFWQLVKSEFKNPAGLERELLDYWFFVQHYSPFKSS